MDRWWTDPHIARSTLECVDDSDPIQGVGTALLGYHGLSEGVLRPLTQQTLLDVESISKALDGLDIAPVAQALANATRPVVGDGADKYGELLARDIHQQAVESTGRFVLNLVATGMAWPTAIDRAASVHGVPVDRLGKAGSVLRAPALAKIAQADISDRALMEYAEHVGKREYVPEVVSKAYREREWREELVNRDAIGRFSDKPDNSLGGLKRQLSESDMARRELRQKRKQQKAAKRKNQVSTQLQQGASLADILRANAPAKVTELRKPAAEKSTPEVDPIKAAADKKIQERIDQKINARIDQAIMDRVVAALANRDKKSTGVSDEEDLFDPPYEYQRNEKELYPGFVASAESQQLFMIASKHDLQMALQQGGFNMGKMRDIGAIYEPELLNREELRGAILNYSYGHDDALDDVAILAIDGPVAFNADLTVGYQTKPADEGDYSVTHRNRKQTGQLETDDYLDMDLKVYAAPGMRSAPKKSISLPNLTVSLLNDKDFERYRGGAIHKSQNRQWREELVNRDQIGRFADRPSSGVTASQDLRQQRLDRKAKKRKMAQDRLKAMSQDRTLANILSATAAQEKPQQVQQSVQQTSNTLTNDAVDNRIDELMERRIQSAVDERINTAIDRKIAAARKKVADRKERLEDFRFTHEDWKEMDVVAFRDEADMLTLGDLFNYDPFNNGEANFDVDPSQRADIADMLIKPKSSADIVDLMHRQPPMATGEPEPVLSSGTQALFDNPAAAHWAAQAEADEMNRKIDSAVESYKPLVTHDTEHSQFPFYQAWIVPVSMKDTDVLVFGTKSDWAAVKRGDATTLEPLEGFDNDINDPGVGAFDELFAVLGDDEAFRKQIDFPTRSDFYVRAFRIKT